MAIRSAIVILVVVLCRHTVVSELPPPPTLPPLSAGDGHSYCAYVDLNVAQPEFGKLLIGESTQQESDRHLLFNNTVQRCIDDSHHCLAFWYVDHEAKDSITILKQGCWNNEKGICGRSQCISDRGVDPEGISNITRFCCCHGNMCNVNLTDIWVPGKHADTSDGSVSKHPKLYETKVYGSQRVLDIVKPLGAVAAVAVLVICVFLAVRCHLAARNHHLGAGLGAVDGEPLSGPCPGGAAAGQWGAAGVLDGLKLNTVISSGRYGEVWKGVLNDVTVAVKVIRAGSRNMYHNERDILSLPLMDPTHVPIFYGYDEKLTLDGMPEYLLVSHYIDLGMLQTYLKNNVLHWSEMCNMLHSISSALTFLHTEIHKGDQVKPAIAHRDLNTRNILVKADLRCVICDFGFAMKLDRQRSDDMGDQPTLSDVGTIRYMAPEVLDGAVNLRECDTSLKQIDIYSLGLVFWEVGMRCSDLYQGLPVPEYMLPFQADVGIHPSFEEMQDFVSREKRRPLFPDVWKSSNSAIRALKETIEDCWDQDGEARLTSHCVEERVVEMAALWEARHKGVTPTVNATATLGTVGLEGKKTEPCNLPASSAPPAYHYASSRGPSVSSSSEGSSYPRYSALENSTSEATTETIMLSPSDSDVITPPPAVSQQHQQQQQQQQQQAVHNLMYYPKQSRQLAPHQGLNPTVARNTHKSSDEDMSVRGNTLLVPCNSAPPAPTSSHTPLITDALIDAIEENLVRNDILLANNTENINQVRYPDNEVASEPLMVTQQPKQQNLPQPGTSPKFKSFFGRLRQKNKPGGQGQSSSSSRFSLPFFTRNVVEKSHDGGSSEEHMDNLVEIRPGHYRTRSSEAGELVRQQKCNLTRRPLSTTQQQQQLQEGAVGTEVRLVGGQAVVQPSTPDSPRRPNSLFLHGGHNYPPLPAPAPVLIPPPPQQQPVYNEMPLLPAGQPIFNEMPLLPAGQPIYNEMPALPAGQPIFNEMPLLPAGQPIYNEMPAFPANPPPYNPANLSVNVVPGAAWNEQGDVGGAFSLGSDSGPPPNVDLPPDLISNSNLSRVHIAAAAVSAQHGSTVAPPVFGPPPPVMAAVRDLALPPSAASERDESSGEGERC